MAEAHAVAFIDKVEMRINLQDMKIALIVKRVDTRNIDRMVPANGDGQGICCKRGAHALFDIGMAFLRIGMDNIRIAHIDHAHRSRQIDAIVFVIIGSGMPETE